MRAGTRQFGRDWVIAPPATARQDLARQAGVSTLLAQLLLNRKIDSAAEARAFLTPEFRSLLPPERLPGAVEAGARLLAAAREKRRIVIYGDYDVDGVTASAILWHGLRLAGADVDYYVPKRLEEGYGVNTEALRRLAADGARLVITVDCGVTAHEQARVARELGVELIITDHHEPRGGLPEADLVVHPTARGVSENPHLSGAGVALKVGWALAQAMSEGRQVAPELREYLLDATAFAALGLIADVVPLTGENRIIATYGLRRLRSTPNAGLRALIDVSGLQGKGHYDDYDIGFVLAPRLNAIGRLGHAAAAVELFTRAGAARANEIAQRLDGLNRERQEVERGIVKQAEAMVVERGFDRESCRGIVLASPEWHPGVVGIVASRMVDRFCRPSVLIALEGGQGQGSARSVVHFPLHEALARCGQHLLSHGGHAMAAGVRVEEKRLADFTTAFLSEAAYRLTDADLRPRLRIDDEVALADLTTEVVTPMHRMAPFGVGNARPIFCTGPVDVVETRPVGRNGAHLQLRVRQDGAHRKAIAFFAGEMAEQLRDRSRVRLAFEPVLNEWNGRTSVELKVVDWKPVES